MSRAALSAPWAILILACGARTSGPPPAGLPAPTPASSVRAEPASRERSSAADGTCGALGCRLFDTPEQAFAEVLRSHPRVIGVGESHAQRGVEGIPSSTARFTERLLPLLQGRASDLVLELIVADGSCGKKMEAKVAEQQKPVTEPQRESNQNEFVVMGNRANELGIRPHVLRPSCPDYERIAAAGEDAVPVMLTLIADETVRLARAILERNARQGVDRTVIAYGGAMHNDRTPRDGMQEWAYGARIAELAEGRYVEVDLIVPEFIRDTAAWKALPWYAHFDRQAHPGKVTLYEPSPGSYTLIFATSSGAQPGSG